MRPCWWTEEAYVRAYTFESSLRDLWESFGESEEEIQRRFKEREEKLKKEYARIYEIYQSFQPTKKYRDYWFTWLFGDNDFFEALEEGAKAIAEEYSECYYNDLWNLATAHYELESYKADTSWRTGDWKRCIREKEKEVKESRMKTLDQNTIFWNPQELVKAIARIGVSIHCMRRFRGDDSFEKDLEYMLGGQPRNVGIGRAESDEILRRSDTPPGGCDNIERCFFNGGECVAVHIEDGKIKFCKAI